MGESLNDSGVERVVNNVNDNHMFSLRNFMLSLEDSSIDADTTLS